MQRKMTHLLLAAACTLAVACAQGPKGPGGQHNGSGSGVDVAAAQTISGAITALQVSYGAQYPTMVVAQTQIKLAPIWFLLESDFELTVGDQVEVLAAPCTCAGGSYVALKITKDGVTVELRDELGFALWQSGRGSGQMGSGLGLGSGPNPAAPRSGEGGIDASTITTVTGMVESVILGAGIQQPTLVLKAGGAAVSIKIGPERVLFASDVELKPGQEVTVRYGVATRSGENVALSLTVGRVTVVLRDDDGRPVWNR